MTTLTYVYSGTGRERIAVDCAHGSTALRGAELFLVPEPFTELFIRHRAVHGCTCEPDRMVRRWPDARDALAMLEAMAQDIPADVDALDIDVMLADLAELRIGAACPGCIMSWTTVAQAGGKLSRTLAHAEGCAEYERRRDAGELRPPSWSRLDRVRVIQ